MLTSSRSESSRTPYLISWFGGTFITAMLIAMIGPTGCGGGASSDKCRLYPEDCRGAAGTLCNDDRDCNGGLECCTDNNNCGGGMCTFECQDDRDCPIDMLCQHDLCFYACNSDDDCADSMSCEHGNTVCEYP